MELPSTQSFIFIARIGKSLLSDLVLDDYYQLVTSHAVFRKKKSLLKYRYNRGNIN